MNSTKLYIHSKYKLGTIKPLLLEYGLNKPIKEDFNSSINRVSFYIGLNNGGNRKINIILNSETPK